MVIESDPGDRDYLKLLDDDEDSDIDEDAHWKRARSSSKKSPEPHRPSINSRLGPVRSPVNRSPFNEADLGIEREASGGAICRTINFDDDLLNRPIVKKLRTDGPGVIASPVRSQPATPSKVCPSDPAWKRISFPGDKGTENQAKPAGPSRIIITRPNLATLKPPSSLAAKLSDQPNSQPKQPPSASPLIRARLPIGATPTKKPSEVPLRFVPTLKSSQQAPRRPPIPDNLNFASSYIQARQTQHQQPQPERDVDLNTFVNQIRAEMLAHRSLDRIYSRSMRELTSMKKYPGFQSLIKPVIEGVLFDPEVDPNDETSHKIIKVLQNFDLDTTLTWSILINQLYTLITGNTGTHHQRLSKFIEMTVDHLTKSKIRLMPSTAEVLFKLARDPLFARRSIPPSAHETGLTYYGDLMT